MSNALQKSGFSLEPANMNEAMQMAQMIAGSNIVPNSYKNNQSDTLVAMMLGTELGLNPIQSLQNIAVINGRPALWGDSMLALVQNHHAFESIEESFDDQGMTATCTVTRKGGKPHTSKFAQWDAEKANLWNRKGPWQQYPKRMLAMRARGFALRNQFADALAGLITAEEAEDMPVDAPHVTETQSEPVVEHFSQEKFDKGFGKWAAKIRTGERTKDDLIATLTSKGELTEEMLKRINGIEITEVIEGELVEEKTNETA